MEAFGAVQPSDSPVILVRKMETLDSMWTIKV